MINKSKLKPELPDCFLGNETLITDLTEISNKFHEYFVNVGPKLASKIPDSVANLSTFLGERSLNAIFFGSSDRERSRI